MSGVLAMKLATITGRKEHAARINEVLRQAVGTAVEVGLRIIDAREGLEHGDYIAMIEEDLHCQRAAAFKFVAIASNKTISNVSHEKHLPTAWTTLYDLTVAAKRGLDLEAGIAGGTIHPKMERKDVKALLPAPQRDDDLEDADADDDTSARAPTDDDAREQRCEVMAVEMERLATRLIKFDPDIARTLHTLISQNDRAALSALCQVIERKLRIGDASDHPDRWSDR